MQPVDDQRERQVTPVRGVPGEAAGQHDAQRQDQSREATGQRSRERYDQEKRERPPARDPDRAEVRTRQNQWQRRHRLGEISPGHDAGSRDEVAGRGDDQDRDDGRDPVPKPAARRFELREVAREHDELQDQIADEDRQSEKPEPAAERRQEERVECHFTVKEKSPSVR